MISRIGFGCAGIAGHDYGPVEWDQAVAALRAAVDAGVTFVDVANVYGLGRAESIVGEAIPAGEGVVVATKVGLCWDDERRTWRDIRPEAIERSIEGSLRRLRRDVLDVVQVHWPDGNTPVADAVVALARCREQGKVRSVGVCNFTGDEVREALGAVDLVSLQLPASMIQRASFELLGAARDRHGMTPLCYNVLGQGLLTGRYAADDRFAGADVRQRSVLFREPMLGEALARVEAMRGIARERDATIGQVATRWLLDALPGSCAILGTKSAAQAGENCRVIEPLTRDEFESIEAAGAAA
ncbi:MAG: aldo/keto reductase [Phycisphaerales bacterium]|jgi:aryl-alcohol dehydrogenase-like predicted oxidoreductase